MEEVKSSSSNFFSERQAKYLLGKSTDFWDSTIGSKHWHFTDVFESADLSGVADVLEHAAKSLFFVEAAVEGFKVVEAYRAHEDWEYEMIQDGTDLVVGIGIGMIVAGMVSGGWAVAVIASLAAGIGSLVADHYGNPFLRHKLEPAVHRFSKRHINPYMYSLTGKL